MSLPSAPGLGSALSEREPVERVQAEVPEDLPPEPGTGNGQVALGAEEAPRTWGSSDRPSLPVLVRKQEQINYFCLYSLFLLRRGFPRVSLASSLRKVVLSARQLSVVEAPPGRPRQPPSPGSIFTVTADGPTGEAAWGSSWAGRAASVSGEGRATEGLVPAPHPGAPSSASVCRSVGGGP